MFQGWQLADVAAAIAMTVSGLAFFLSVAAVRYSAVQAGIAERRERFERAAYEPAIEPEITPHATWPQFYWLRVVVRNRLDIAIVVEDLTILAPRDALLISCEEAADGQMVEGRYVLDARTPRHRMRRQAKLATMVHGLGARLEFGLTSIRQDEAQVDLLVLLPSRSRDALRLSLDVRRVDERSSFAVSVVEAKLPTARAPRAA